MMKREDMAATLNSQLVVEATQAGVTAISDVLAKYEVVSHLLNCCASEQWLMRRSGRRR